MLSSLALLLWLTPQESAAPDMGPFVAELRGLRQQVTLLETALRQRDETLTSLRNDLRAVGQDVAEVKGRAIPPPASPFMGGPPASSDTVGVAKTVVFAPRVEGDTTRHRDVVRFKVRRVEPGGFRSVGDVELGSEGFVDLPVDQNGALYVVDWTTTEGQNFNLILRDGATGQEAASARIMTLQSQGRFIYVAYRLD